MCFQLTKQKFFNFHNFATTQTIFKQNTRSPECVNSHNVKIMSSENAWDLQFVNIS